MDSLFRTGPRAYPRHVATPEDIESRLSAVERDVARLREQQGLSASDATAARVLAAGADRDVSEVRAELRAHTSGLNALREVQVAQGRQLERLEGKVDQGFADVGAAITTVQTGMARVVTLLEGLDGR